MIHLEGELGRLKATVIEMLNLTILQLRKAKETVLFVDSDLAEEVMHNETRLDSYELSVLRDCENLFALFTPVASDLRFVMAMLKISSNLERIGDNARGIAALGDELKKPYKEELINESDYHAMFDISIEMLEHLLNGLVEADSRLVRKVFKKDKQLDAINEKIPGLLENYIIEDHEGIQDYFRLFSIFRKLERVGDLAKNVAEEIIFHLEAEIVKHNKKKLKNFLKKK